MKPSSMLVSSFSRISGSTELFHYPRIRRRRLVLCDRPFWGTLTCLGGCPAFRCGANFVGLDARCAVCHSTRLLWARKRGAINVAHSPSRFAHTLRRLCYTNNLDDTYVAWLFLA